MHTSVFDALRRMAGRHWFRKPLGSENYELRVGEAPKATITFLPALPQPFTATDASLEILPS